MEAAMGNISETLSQKLPGRPTAYRFSVIPMTFPYL